MRSALGVLAARRQAMAMADTLGPTYTVKVAAHAWRPTTATQQADTDGNPATTAESWTSRSGEVGGSPEHWSGDSSFSAAGAAVLAAVLCRDDVPFTLVTDSGGGAARSYRSFSQAAEEAGLSRVLGGLHFPFSNTAGLRAGSAIAAEVVSRALQPLHSQDRC